MNVVGEMMMAHCTALSFMQGTISSYCTSFNGFSRKPFIVVENKKSILSFRISSKVQEFGDISSSWLESETLESVVLAAVFCVLFVGIVVIGKWFCSFMILCDSYAYDDIFGLKFAGIDNEVRFCLYEEEAVPAIQTLRKFPVEELSSKIVLVRFDSSILLPQKLNQQYSINSSAYFTIKYIHKAGGKVVLVSSWNVKENSKILSEEAVAEFLSSILQLKVVIHRHKSGHHQPKIEEFEQANVILLDNLSKYKQELANDSEFARRLACGVDVYVNDSFSSVHKIFASTVGVTQFCNPCIAGFYLEECLLKMKKIPECNRRPFIAVVGGGNLFEKAAALLFLVSKCDGIVFVGNVAFQVMHALGLSVPLNLVEEQSAKKAVEIVKYAKHRSIPILLPKDILCKNIHIQSHMQTFSAVGILDGWEPVDLGPNSFVEIASFLSGCKKILWIGPPTFGPPDDTVNGTYRLACILHELSQHDCLVSMVGHTACETAFRISEAASTYEMIGHAAVVWEFLKGRNLPGLLALDRAYPFEINWSSVYLDPTQPLAVDIGSGNGLFLMGMAKLHKNLNFLGLEINEKLVIRCLESSHHSGLTNIYFIATNATSSFRDIVSSYPGSVELVSIQCPNPDFNQPEHRWRMVQRSLVEAIADELAPGGKVFLQSDVEEVAQRMRKQFLTEGKRKLVIVVNTDHVAMADSGGWLKENPFGVWSDWERRVLARGAPMYRLMFVKKMRNSPLYCIAKFCSST